MRALVAVLVCLGLIFSVNLASADEGPEPGLNPNVVSLLGPIKHLLSGRAGLIVDGFDPLMAGDLKRTGLQEGAGSLFSLHGRGPSTTRPGRAGAVSKSGPRLQ